MNGAREDANARDMFLARRKKTRVERGLGSDVPRDGGWTGGRELAPRALRQARADWVRNLGRAESAPFATLGRLSRIEGWRANFRWAVCFSKINDHSVRSAGIRNQKISGEFLSAKKNIVTVCAVRSRTARTDQSSRYRASLPAGTGSFSLFGRCVGQRVQSASRQPRKSLARHWRLVGVVGRRARSRKRSNVSDRARRLVSRDHSSSGTKFSARCPRVSLPRRLRARRRSSGRFTRRTCGG